MIHIVKGTFGWYDGRRVRPKTPSDPPFQADDRLEARLVAEGVAEYVGADGPSNVVDGAVDVQADDRDLESMTKEELADLAESMGVTVGRKTKTQIIAAIKEADKAPDLSAAEVE